MHTKQGLSSEQSNIAVHGFAGMWRNMAVWGFIWEA